MRSAKVPALSLFLLATLCGGPLRAQSPAGLPARAATAIALRSGVLDTSRPAPELPERLKARPAGPGEEEVVLVKFPGPVTSRQFEALRAGARIYAYLPYYTYLVKLPAGAAKSGLARLGASWTGPYHPAYKISPEIAAMSAPEPGAPGEARAEAYRPVMVQVFPDADLTDVMRTIEGLGARAIVGARRDALFSRVRLLLSPAEIAALRESLAAMPEVFWIELEPRKALLNDTTVWVGQSGLSGGQTTPIFSQGIFGEGQTVAVIDTGIDADSCYFRDTALGLPPVNACNGGTTVNSSQRKVLAVDFLTGSECLGGISGGEWDTHGHGTHVAGTVAGDNFAHLLTPRDTADGMAPGARLVIQDAGYLTDNCADLPGLGCPVVDLKPLFQQAYNQGARLHTNSWGDNENGAVQNNYTVASQDVDQFLWDHKDDLIFFAAGNSGPGTGSVGSPSTNKNGVSVGATLRGTSADSMASFSSCGPTADGRIKPDLTIPGSSIVSAGNDANIATNNCGTATMSGTSMASPGATGLAALVRQYFADGWYPTGSKVSTDGFTPSGALVKAALINSAVNMANAIAIPGNCQGWGRILLENALYFTGQGRKLWVKDNDTPFATGSAGEARTYTFTVSSGAEPFKATLAWTDFPSTPAAAVNLNNDLDLVVTGPGGTFLGNVFSGGVSAAGGAADRRNTLEQVLLASPPPGTYTVSVHAFNVPNGPQPFALVVTGALGAGCSTAAECDDGLFCNGAETCSAGLCQAGSNPCGALACSEATDTCTAAPAKVIFTSVAAQDGWVLESGEATSAGGSIDAAGTTTSALRLGDDNKDRQYKAVVSFDTSAIPDGATIVSATLRLRRGTVSGTDPFTTHGTCWVDLQTGGLSGSTALQTGDFQAAATAVRAASLSAAAANGDWSAGSLNAAGLAAIDKTGTTQFRVYFALDDNDDRGTDFLGYYSGDNATAANRPQLEVTYQ